MNKKFIILKFIWKILLKKTISYYEFVLWNTKKNDEKNLLKLEEYQKIINHIKNKVEIVKISTYEMNADFLNLCSLLAKKNPKILFVEILINDNFNKNKQIIKVLDLFKNSNVYLILLSDGNKTKINFSGLKRYSYYFANLNIKPIIKVIIGKNNIKDFAIESKNIIYFEEFRYFFDFIKPNKKINNLTKLDLIPILDFLIHNTKNIKPITFKDKLHKNINLSYYKAIKKILKKERKMTIKFYKYYKINSYGKVSYSDRNFNLRKNNFNLKEFYKQNKNYYIKEDFLSYEIYLMYILRRFLIFLYLVFKSFFIR